MGSFTNDGVNIFFLFISIRGIEGNTTKDTIFAVVQNWERFPVIKTGL